MPFTSGALSRSSASFARNAQSNFDPGPVVLSGDAVVQLKICGEVVLAVTVMGDTTTV